MKTNPSQPVRRKLRSQRGFMMMDLMVAMFILTLAILPLTFSFVRQTQLLRAEYQRGVAMEIVDGEMEILAAGDWRNFPDGTEVYPVRAKAAVNLPPGKFQLTRNGNHLRLEWNADERSDVKPVIRKATVK